MNKAYLLILFLYMRINVQKRINIMFTFVADFIKKSGTSRNTCISVHQNAIFYLYLYLKKNELLTVLSFLFQVLSTNRQIIQNTLKIFNLNLNKTAIF